MGEESHGDMSCSPSHCGGIGIMLSLFDYVWVDDTSSDMF